MRGIHTTTGCFVLLFYNIRLKSQPERTKIVPCSTTASGGDGSEFRILPPTPFNGLRASNKLFQLRGFFAQTKRPILARSKELMPSDKLSSTPMVRSARKRCEVLYANSSPPLPSIDTPPEIAD